MDRFEVAVLAAAAGVSCCHTDDYKVAAVMQTWTATSINPPS